MNRRKLWVAAVVALVAAVPVGFALQGGVTFGGGNVYRSATAVYDSTGSPTHGDANDLLEAWMTNQPIDPMWNEADGESEVAVANTGISKAQTREVLHIATVTDELTDLDRAEIYLDGVLKNTATLGNGGITDNGDGTGTATLNLWVPRNGVHDYRVEWENASGVKKTRELSN